MYCPKCGKQLPDDAAYCDACGARFAPEPELIYEQPKRKEEPKKEDAPKPDDFGTAFRKWVKEQGLFCLIAKAVSVTVMFFYLLVAIVYTISLAVADYYSGGYIFSQFFTVLLNGIVYGVIIWLLSDAVLYLTKLYQMKKQELKK